MPNVETRHHPGLARRLGLFAATMTGLGVIIGSGIYVIIGVAAGSAGNAVWMSFLLAAIGASLSGISYARLSKLKPQNAPEYQFVNLAYGNQPAFYAGWLILLAQIVSSSAVALGFAGYFHALTGFPELPVAIVLILICSLILYVGISQSALVAIILTVTEIVGLLIIIGIGFPYLGKENYFVMPLGLAGVFSGAALVFFAYLGFEGMANLSEEMKNPEKNLPKAILLAIGLSTVFYVLVAISAVSVIGWNDLSQSSAPLALVAERALGSNTGFVLSLISLASTGNTVLILLLAASRIVHALSRARVLPEVLAVVSKRQQTPWLAILVGGILAIIFACLGNIQQIAEYTNFITLIAFVSVNAAVFKLFSSKNTRGRFKHLLVNRVAPSLGIVVSIWLAVNTGWRSAIFGLLILAAGAVIYWITRLATKNKKP